MIKHDILIIGGGLAGLRAAIEIGNKADCAIICKTYPNLAHSSEAQGGINAAISKEDKWQDHLYDTVYGGDFLVDQNAAEILCKEAAGVINELVEWGVKFNRVDGKIVQRPFGAQRFIRTAFAADRTGHALLHSLYKKVLEMGIKVYNEWQVISLSVSDNKVNGVYAIDGSDGQIKSISSKATIIASGGGGRIYGKTTNPSNSGDGIAMAYEIGAEIMDMEMMQFHPTTLRGSNKLLSEAARGEGAYLINSLGERFMKKYAPQKMELASRDVVSRAEATEISQGRGVFGDSVYLDFRHMDPHIIMSKVPDIRKNGIELAGIDILKDPIPVQPGQHYTMGGIRTDTDGKSNIGGLFAAGECACVSVHGANRLGGNSLMETLVFGRRAAKSALKYIQNSINSVINQNNEFEEEKIKKWIKNEKGKMPREIRIELGKIMDNYVGPFRNEEMLKTAYFEIEKLNSTKLFVSEHNDIFNAELQAAYEISFMLSLAKCIVISALDRKESRGAHTRLDYPKRDDKNFLKHIICTKNIDGPKITYKEVNIESIKPVERHY